MEREEQAVDAPISDHHPLPGTRVLIALYAVSGQYEVDERMGVDKRPKFSVRFRWPPVPSTGAVYWQDAFWSDVAPSIDELRAMADQMGYDVVRR